MNSNRSSLYLCYQSISEPLTQTQVVAYLEGLALANYTIILLTFEPRALTEIETDDWRTRMEQKGIIWRWVRYHKSPTVPATAWDIAVGIATGLGLIRRYKIRLIHARSHVPGLMALGLKHLTGAKVLFDLRGFMGEEYVDAGIWRPDGLLFRLIKRAERALVRNADGIVVLTVKAHELLKQWYPVEMRRKVIQVIPCCVDLRHNIWNDQQKPESSQAKDCTLVYVGKLGGWYLDKEMADFVVAAAQIIPHLKWQVWTQSDSANFRKMVERGDLNQHIAIGQLSRAELAVELRKAQAGLSFIKPCLSKRASSPTKVGEYLAAGLPVVSTAGIGDVDDLLNNVEGKAVGVLVNDFSPSSYTDATSKLKALLDDPGIRQRCRAVAREHLDLEQVGWLRYRSIYSSLLGNSFD